jgi:hypothetical protein
MPIHHAIWKVATQPQPLVESSLASEKLLEEMIVAAPRVLSEEWMLIGRQEDTGFGGRIDLLAIAPDGALVLIELKRDRTPREVVAQSLDYAGWVETLRPEDIAAIYGRFAPNRSLAEDFRQRFGHDLDEESLKESHQIVVVASSLDDSTERIIAYLSDRDVPINGLFFQVFTHGAEQLLSRAWLLDPVRTQAIAASTPDGPNEPWNGEFVGGCCAIRVHLCRRRSLVQQDSATPEPRRPCVGKCTRLRLCGRRQGDRSSVARINLPGDDSPRRSSPARCC